MNQGTKKSFGVFVKELFLAVLSYIDNLKKRRHINYLLRCPVCKSEDVSFFSQNLRKVSFFKAVALLFRHEYYCKKCHSFISAKKILKYPLQMGDEGYITQEQAKKQNDSFDEALRKKFRALLDKIFGYSPSKKEELLYGPFYNYNSVVKNETISEKHESKGNIDVVHLRKDKHHVLEKVSRTKEVKHKSKK